jgi:hypothetical protein
LRGKNQVARLFISHSSANNAAALALRTWLVEQGFQNEVFLDIDPERGLVAGERWQEALKAAADRCEAVLILVSPAWLESKWCLAEFLLARSLHKRIFGLIVEPVPFERLPPEMTAEWQLCHLVGEDRFRSFDVEVLGKVEKVDFREAGLDLLRRGIERAGLDARDFAWPPRDEPNRAPYRGLKALEPQDAAIFFGRDAWTVRGLDRIRGLAERGTEKILVVLGASGSGKSSFLRAGLWPRLLRNDAEFLPLPVMRPQTAAISGSTGLAVALSNAFVRFGVQRPPGVIKEALSGDAAGLGRMLDELLSLSKQRLVATQETQTDPTIIVPLDQAEELFIADGAAEAARFLELLACILAPPEGTPARRLLVIATTRSDKYELLQAEPRLQSVKRDLFDLSPITPAEFKIIIERPAHRVVAAGGKLAIEAALTERLTADAQGADALPLLAFTLERLYADYGGAGRLTLADYEKLGGVQGSIEAAVTQALNEPGRAPAIPVDQEAKYVALHAAFIPWLARIDFDSGVPLRRVARRSEIPESSRAIVDRLVEARLLVADRRDGIDMIEVSHESLLRRWQILAVWLEQATAELKLVEGVERAAAEWDVNGRAEMWLDHRSDRLLQAEQLVAREAFRRRVGDKGVAYLLACRAREEAEQRGREEALNREAARLAEIAAAQMRTARLQRVRTWALSAAAGAVVIGVGAVGWEEARLTQGHRALAEQMDTNKNLQVVLQKQIDQTKPPAAGSEIVVDFTGAAIADPERAAHTLLESHGIQIGNVVPAGSKIKIVPHSTLYGDASVVPTASPNFLTQTDTENGPASFTLFFDDPLDAFSFVRPYLYRATKSGVTFPAWKATALDRAGHELSSVSEALLRSIDEIPGDTSAQTYRLRTPTFAKIAAVRFDSDPRLGDKPFAGFSAIVIERLVLLHLPSLVQTGH